GLPGLGAEEGDLPLHLYGARKRPFLACLRGDSLPLSERLVLARGDLDEPVGERNLACFDEGHMLACERESVGEAGAGEAGLPDELPPEEQLVEAEASGPLVLGDGVPRSPVLLRPE